MDGALTRELAALVEMPRLDEATEHAALRCLIDWTGCALAGAESRATACVMQALLTDGPQTGRSTVIGHARRIAARDAALVNGASAHVLDFDDENRALCGHPGAVVISSALAVAEEVEVTGGDLLAAIVAGYETAERLGLVANPSHYAAGWHATATLGAIAAAVGCARILGLAPSETECAVALAATQAAGVRAVFGSDAKPLQVGRAAAAGVLAALLARAGLTVAPYALEADRGYLTAASATNAVPTPRHERPAVHRTLVKKHAACGAAQCLIDAVAGVVAMAGGDATAIETLTVYVSEESVAIASIGDPQNSQEAQFSLSHLAALAAYAYPVLPSTLAPEGLHDPRVVELRERVAIRVESSLAGDPRLPAIAAVTTVAGARHVCRVDVAAGAPEKPLERAGLEQKFFALATPIVGDEVAESLLARLWRVPEVTDLRDLMGSTTRHPANARV